MKENATENPQFGTRAVREYLQGLEQEGQIGSTPKNISLTDPGACWTAAPGCPAFPGRGALRPEVQAFGR